MLEKKFGGCPVKMEEGALSQGMPATSRSWKKQGHGLSPGDSRKTSPANIFQPNETHFRPLS